MPLSRIPGWSTERLESHACFLLNREGLMAFNSQAMARLIGSDPFPWGSTPRPFRADWLLQARLERAGADWRATVASGALARLGVFSGQIDLPRRSGGNVACFWRYVAIPEADPEYHLFIYDPIDQHRDGPEAVARSALRMEAALFEIQSVIDGVGLVEPRRELPNPVDLAALTERELDVMKQILNGMTNHQIAQELHVSLETVKSHAKAIFRKVGVHSRAELMSRFVTSLSAIGSVLLELSIPI
jgi:DNA-binding CsgD family transcriptional regulator